MFGYDIKGAISFTLDIVPLYIGLINVILYVGRVQISCGLLPTRFSSIFLQNSIIVKKMVKFSQVTI